MNSLKSIEQIRAFIPSYIYEVGDVLNSAGYKAYLVGGAVRNILLGLEPKDFDIATDALPEQVEKIFPRSVGIYAKFGTVLVIMQSNTGERFDVEVTTFRKEENYYGGRWPADVKFTDDLYVDLSRRDFTVNAFAIDLNVINKSNAIEGEVVIDYFDGKVDLENKVIRAVGKPIDRFTEDGLRSFRACRLASVYGFTIEEATFRAIHDTLHVSKIVSMERIRDEFLKTIYNSAKPSYGIELLRESGLLEIFMPELLDTIGIVQPIFHSDDLYTHSLKALDIAEDSVKIAALLHDIGKTKTKIEDAKGIHFYGHDVVGAEMTDMILTRMRLPKSEVKRNVTLVRWHMFFYPSAQWRKEYADEDEVESVDGGGWTDAAVRRFVQKVGEDMIEDLFKLRIADATANPKMGFDQNELQVFSDRISDVRSKDMVLKVKDLDIDGDDLMAIGVNPGPEMGNILNALLELVIDDTGMNKKELLLNSAKDIIQKGKSH